MENRDAVVASDGGRDDGRKRELADLIGGRSGGLPNATVLMLLRCCDVRTHRRRIHEPRTERNVNGSKCDKSVASVVVAFDGMR